MRVDRRMLTVVVATAVVVAQAPAHAAEETFVMKHGDARLIADAFWDTGYHEDMEEDLDRFAWEFANDLVRDAVRRLPYTQAYWVPGTVTRRYPRPLKGNQLHKMLPRQVHHLVEVVPSKNALVVNGSQIALNQFREMLEMLDAPSRSVVMEVHWVNLPSSELEALDIDWAVQQEGGKPGGARVNADGVRALLERADPYQHVLTASVMAKNNAPAIVAFGETMPYFAGGAKVDRFDPRPGSNAQVRAVFAGTVLPVMPRINTDNSLTVRVRPSVCYWAGPVDTSQDVDLSMRLYRASEAQVTVGEGESLLVEVERGDQAMSGKKFYGLAPRIRPRLAYRSVLVVTPTVLEYVEPGGE